LPQTYGKARPAEKALPPVAPTVPADLTWFEVNGAKQLLGQTFDSIKQVINRAEKTHEGILNSFRKVGWSTEVSLLGGYRCDAYKDGVVVEIEAVDKSSVIDVLHRDLFRFQMLQRMGVLKVAVEERSALKRLGGRWRDGDIRKVL
jgi:hypothetical protein